MTFARRVAATAVAVAVFAVFVLHRTVLQPMFLQIAPAWAGTWAGMGVSMAALVLPLLALALGYLWSLRRYWRTPATLQRSADGMAFTVPSSPVTPGGLAIMLMLLAGNGMPFEKVPGTDRIGLPTDPTLQEFIALPALLTLLAAALLWLPAPGLRLTPDGITVRYTWRTRIIRWGDLLPGGPHPGNWTIRLLQHGPNGDLRACRIPLYRWYVDGSFLASVLRHYTERPEHRPDIGTETELDRLRTGYQHQLRKPAAQPA